MFLLDIMPSVPEMQKYLRANPGSHLSDWTSRMCPAVVGLLRWIIASNRACIFQVDDPPTNGENPSHDNPLSVRKSEQRVKGMSGLLQFRMAMGAPDKEKGFVDAIHSQNKSKEFPTMFA